MKKEYPIIDAYIEIVTKEIKNKKIRREVADELFSHIIENYDRNILFGSGIPFAESKNFDIKDVLFKSRIVYISEDAKTIVKELISSAEVPGNALISAVASDKTVRGAGIGRKTVLTMLSELQSEGKNIYVIALNESAEGFYEHLGFEFKE